MGSKIVSKLEAAKMLGISERKVYRLINQGYLTTQRVGLLVGIPEDEVIRFSKADGEPAPAIAFSPKNFAKLWEEMQMVKAQLTACMRMLNIKLESLNLEDQELQNLHTMATMYSEKGWPPQVEDVWASTFLRISTPDFEQLKKLTKDEHPWRPFYLLCAMMAHTPYDKTLKDLFIAGRSHIHGLAYVWGQLHGLSHQVLDRLMRHEATPGKRLLNKIEHKQEGFPDTAKDPRKGG
jgi:excisionase family DNA binding protein